MPSHDAGLFSSFRSPVDAARKHALGRILRRVASACDLACGTGTTALALASEGIRTFAVDISPIMCRLAREKARRARLPLRVLCADMRTSRLPEPVDLITCEYDEGMLRQLRGGHVAMRLFTESF
jgi:methylase of polypeptide subunit release factors